MSTGAIFMLIANDHEIPQNNKPDIFSAVNYPPELREHYKNLWTSPKVVFDDSQENELPIITIPSTPPNRTLLQPVEFHSESDVPAWNTFGGYIRNGLNPDGTPINLNWDTKLIAVRDMTFMAPNDDDLDNKPEALEFLNLGMCFDKKLQAGDPDLTELVLNAANFFDTFNDIDFDNFPALISLKLVNQYNLDCTVIAKINQLKTLILCDCHVNNHESLAKLSNLENLSIISTNINDLRFLSRMTHLKTLTIRDYWTFRINNYIPIINLKAILDISRRTHKPPTKLSDIIRDYYQNNIYLAIADCYGEYIDQFNYFQLAVDLPKTVKFIVLDYLKMDIATFKEKFENCEYFHDRKYQINYVWDEPSTKRSRKILMIEASTFD